MYILGINCAYHESSACLIRDGQLVAFAEEERFTRKKRAKDALVYNPDELPIESINYCLKKENTSIRDIQIIGYSLNPKERLTKNKSHSLVYQATPNDFGTLKGEKTFYEKNLEVEAKIRNIGFNGRFEYINHHDCHAASTYFVSGFKESGVLVVDGIGEFESTTMYKGSGNQIHKIKSIEFPNSIGFLWEKICKYLGFSQYDACKVMGLASYGNSQVYKEAFNSIIDISEDGMFVINDSITQFRNENYDELEKLFCLKKLHAPIRNIDTETQPYVDLASSLQEITEIILIRLANTIKTETKSSNLCLSGGVALNCVANGKLLDEKIFDNIFIQPASNDAGTSIGAAFYIWNQQLGNPASYVFDSPYLSATFSEKEIESTIESCGLQYRKYNDFSSVTQETAKLLSNGKVVSWFQDAMELGPRALGNRSILFDPRKKDAVDLLNYKVKHREPFRPFCPSVLSEEASKWFSLGSTIPSPAKYMLGAFRVIDDKKDVIPAVTHVDGTARVQVVENKLNPKYYQLIESFEKLTGVPVLLNTSFNDQEPIICNPQDAVETFTRTRIDYLVIGNFIVSKSEC